MGSGLNMGYSKEIEKQVIEAVASTTNQSVEDVNHSDIFDANSLTPALEKLRGKGFTLPTFLRGVKATVGDLITYLSGLNMGYSKEIEKQVIEAVASTTNQSVEDVNHSDIFDANSLTPLIEKLRGK